MRKPPCDKNCPKRKPACHDTCKDYLEWRDYIRDTKKKQARDHFSYRSKATERKRKHDMKKYGGKHMKNKF